MTTGVLQAVGADGTTWDDPSEEQLHDLLADTSLGSRFVVVRRLDLEPADQHCMRVFLNDDLSHQVEEREGGPDRHFQTWVPREQGVFAVESVAEVLQGWACGRPGWRGPFSRVPWSPAESCARHHLTATR
ncbi:hypothetical protein E2C00_16855 [Streptomyces sp. WAC05374]|uniref:hypothetical protein n=1 Tax=Streptomyces sp. WAC05374 TaxID=2487420 RepID=UPI000F863494|nr:hypothetical protein [Streptomyces sp. WAC05374]RST07576.1 hypothetical protein EF905_31380 [Streptomyces sp. WAC05374]TDF54594.1 hypothetical protein E2C00_16855 [Streptomyces sp. WAC05374]TDF56229.1 hypothetical protein E2C02_12310 [Streptomyces sp. WAC05374]